MAWSGGEYDIYLYKPQIRDWRAIGRVVSSPRDVIRYATLSAFKGQYVGTRHRFSGEWEMFRVDEQGSLIRL